MYARFPWYFWPLVTSFEILNHLFFVLVHILGSVLGLVMIVLGLFLTGTIVGAVLGIPMVIAGCAIRIHCHFTPA